jgi:hypothetical protein
MSGRHPALAPNLSIRQYGDIEPHPTCVRFFNIVSSIVSPSSTKTPLSTAREINFLYHELVTSNPLPDKQELEQDPTSKPENLLWNLWDVFFDIVEQIPFSDPAQDKLVSFVVALHSLAPPSGCEKEVDVWGTKEILWRDLSFLKQVAKEEINCTSPLPPFPLLYFHTYTC